MTYFTARDWVVFGLLFTLFTALGSCIESFARGFLRGWKRGDEPRVLAGFLSNAELAIQLRTVALHKPFWASPLLAAASRLEAVADSDSPRKPVFPQNMDVRTGTKVPGVRH